MPRNQTVLRETSLVIDEACDRLFTSVKFLNIRCKMYSTYNINITTWKQFKQNIHLIKIREISGILCRFPLSFVPLRDFDFFIDFVYLTSVLSSFPTTALICLSKWLSAKIKELIYILNSPIGHGQYRYLTKVEEVLRMSRTPLTGWVK